MVSLFQLQRTVYSCPLTQKCVSCLPCCLWRPSLPMQDDACAEFDTWRLFILLSTEGETFLSAQYKSSKVSGVFWQTDKSYCRIEFFVPHHSTMCASLRSNQYFKRISFLIKYSQRSLFIILFGKLHSNGHHSVLRVSIGTTPVLSRLNLVPRLDQQTLSKKRVMKYPVWGRVSGKSSVLNDKLH